MRSRAQQFVVAMCLGLASMGSQLSQADGEVRGLITIEQGDLPIILSAPHGGSEAIPGVPRRQGVGIDLFNSSSDAFTDELTEKLADAIEQRFGKRPYTVISHFHRKYVDANRPRKLAYESDAAKPIYDAYHDALAEARREVIRRWGSGLLLDLHGQATQPEAIFRGTQNGKTTTHLCDRFGPMAVIGENGLFGQLSQQGFEVYPANNSDDAEHANYNGGYIVSTYGSGSGDTLDAIQLELGASLRSRDVNAATAEKLASAIVTFTKVYLRPVRVGVYVDQGTGSSVKSLLAVLGKFEDVAVTRLMAADIRSGALADLDLLIHPGGSGGAQGRHLGEEGREAIREFVRNGGGFIGICAGAYLASADYTWSLNILDAKVLDRSHWNRGNGTVDLSITGAGQRLLHTKSRKLAIHYAQGPLLAPGKRPDIDDYEVLATFETEIAKNGAPQGVMKGTTAIASGQYGRGRVVCFSPHPELTNGLESLLHDAIDHLKHERSQEEAQQ